jgi:hypothetical protein
MALPLVVALLVVMLNILVDGTAQGIWRGRRRGISLSNIKFGEPANIPFASVSSTYLAARGHNLGTVADFEA